MIGSSHKVKNLYCIRKTNHHRVERAKVLRIVNSFFRAVMVIGFICFIGIWGGIEFGPLLIGKRLLWSLIDALIVIGAAYGETITSTT